MALRSSLESIARRGVHALERFVRRVRSFSSGPTRTLALALAAGLFVLQCVFAVRALPDTTLSWPPFVLLVVVGTAGNLVASGLEYALVARALGQRPAPAAVLRISFLSSASNLLPIPGSILVRSASLRAAGAGYREILSAMTAQGLSFMSLTGVITGAVLLLTDLPLVGALILLGGIACAVAAMRLMGKVCDDPIGQTGRLLAGESFVVAVTGVRIWAASLVLGQTLALGAVAALTAASVAATATGIFPGGLGIREALSGAVSPLVGLPVSFGILIGAVDRVAFLLGLGLVAAGLGLVPRGRAILRSGVAQAEFAEVEAEAGVGEVAAGVAEADVLGIDVGRTDVRWSDITSAHVPETLSPGSTAAGTDRTGTDITETGVPETDITETDITETDITETDITETDITETDVSETDVSQEADDTPLE